ncbi:MAG: MFS transporter [Candidatus Syntrophonatronum acetioxidans]|uniref:MFS transporter n=1 Tax=Candidatus Syntrophonatronum acetioxidans TaxID=1795816 RepID=A0A424YA93_9FIRM|nr:MAG: MFS transporter [Candidatus Syntrophonatronum acetioxidans]
MKKIDMFILYLSLIIVMMGFSLAMPVLPFYIESLGGRGVHYGLLIACYGVMQLIFAPLWGSLSDKHGRKPFLLIGLIGLGMAMSLFGLANKLWMLYAAQMLSGSLSSATLPAAQAYVGDSTTGDERGGAMGKIGGAIGLGIVIGPGIGGLLASRSLAAPFFIASGLCLLTFVIILVKLPESLSEESRSENVDIKFMQIMGLWQALFTPIGFGLVVAFMAIFGQTIFSSVFGLYAIGRFSYGPEQVGTIFMAMGLMYALAQGLLVGPITKRFGEQKVISSALLGTAVGFALILLANTFLTILAAVSCFILLNSLLKPSALAFVSKKTVGNQGKAMGITESYMSLGRIIGPLWGGMFFDINLYYPFLSGILLLLIMFIATVSRVKIDKNPELKSNH